MGHSSENIMTISSVFYGEFRMFEMFLYFTLILSCLQDDIFRGTFIINYSIIVVLFATNCMLKVFFGSCVSYSPLQSLWCKMVQGNKTPKITGLVLILKLEHFYSEFYFSIFYLSLLNANTEIS